MVMSVRGYMEAGVTKMSLQNQRDRAAQPGRAGFIGRTHTWRLAHQGRSLHFRLNDRP